MDQLNLAADPRDDTNGCVSNIKLPAQLQKITPAQEFISVRHRWNTNEEIASILIAFDHHKEWLVLPQKIRPASGSMLLYNRKVVFYRRDGYCWKKRRNGSTIREDHMKLKVQGLECIYGSYVHSAILPTFHRRCYWLLQNPNIVLIHYLNVPYPEAAKPSIRPVSYELRSKEWSKEELVDQLRPMLSRVCDGMEHDVEEDQKVEKMLEEILLILMPMHEGNMGKPVLTKPKSLASQPFGPSPTIGEVTPTPGPSSTRTTPSWPSRQQLLQAKQVLITHPQQGIQPQAIHSIRPAAAASTPSTGAMGDGGPGKRVAAVNGGCCHNLVVGAGGHILPQGLVVGNAAGTGLPRFITLGGNQVVMATSGPAVSNAHSVSLMEALGAGGGGGEGSQGSSKASGIHQAQQNNISPGAAVVKTEANRLAEMSNQGTPCQANGNPMPTFSSSTDLFPPSTPVHSNHIRRPLGGGEGSQGSSKASGIHQAQQNNISPGAAVVKTEANRLAEMSNQGTPCQANGNPMPTFSSSTDLFPPSAPVHSNGGPGSTPVLTLHLKPTNSSTSDGPGFVLSLQGATIVSQHSSMPNTSCVSGMSSVGSCQGPGHTTSPGSLVLVASQSPGGSLVLNKISPQPQAQGLFSAQLDTAPGAPSSSVHSVGGGGTFQVQGTSSSIDHSHGMSLSACETSSHTYSSCHTGNNCSASQQHHPFSSTSTCNVDGGSSSAQQALPFGMASCSNSSSSNKSQLLTSLSHQSCGGLSKGMVLNLSQLQTSGIYTSNTVVDMNHKNLISDKAVTSASIFNSHRHPAPSHTSSTAIEMEEMSLHSSQHQHHHQSVSDTSQLSHSHTTQFERCQQQRFETISPPTVPSTPDPATDSIFSVRDHRIPALGSLSTVDAGSKSLENKAGSSDDVLAAFQSGSDLGGCVARFCFDGHSKSAGPRQCSMFGLDEHQLNSPSQNAHHHSHLHHHHHQQNAQDSTAQLIVGTSSILTNSVKHMLTTPSSCDTLDGSFSSLPSADLNLDDLLDLNDLDDVSDLGCSPFTPPDLTQQTADMDKGGPMGAENLGVHGHDTDAHTSHLSTYSCTQISTNHLLQQQQQQQQQHQHHLHLAVPHSSSPHIDQKESYHQHGAPSSPLHPGAPPRPLHPMLYASAVPSPSVCDNTLASGLGTRDPEINSVIKDFSPEWAYTKSVRTLSVAAEQANLNEHGRNVFSVEYTGVVGSLTAPRSRDEDFSIDHSPGYATLQVARNGVIISNCEVFEFCDRESSNSNVAHPEWFAFDSGQLRLLLVERLDQIRRRFVPPQNLCQLSTPDKLDELESSLVQQVQALSGQRLSDVQEFPKAGQHNLTLLHLAAGLGFAKLISCLIRWRMATECVALEFDVDAQSVDSHSCTPLTWACALGKIDAALTLYHWNAAPLRMCNKDGLLPLTLARQKGHYNLASQVEQLEVAKDQERLCQQREFASSNMDLSCSMGHGASDSSPSTVSSDQVSSLPPGSCPTRAPGDEDEKDGAEMKYDEELSESVEPASPFPFSRPSKPGPKLIRRFSEQTMVQQSKTLSKRNSVDLLPSGQCLDQASLPGLGSPSSSPSGMLREPSSPSESSQLLLAGAGGEGRDDEDGIGDDHDSDGVGGIPPDMPDMAFVVPPAPRLMLEEKLDEPSGYSVQADVVSGEEDTPRRDTGASSTTTKMDTDEAVPVVTDSPIIDVERISSDEEVEANKDGSKHQMVTLANQIIAAIPERIKLSPSKDDGEEVLLGRGRSESHSSLPSQGSPRLSSFGDDSGISTPMTDSLAFDEYRYPELGTPSSSLSPDSTCLPSPYSPYSFTLDSPPPTTAEFTEYFNAPTTYMEKDFSQLTLSEGVITGGRDRFAEFTEYFNAPTTYMEKDFSQLTLSDQEQRKLYEAAKVIQNAYRHYRDKQQQKEIEAAILIQSYYRRYKTYAYYKKMSQAAVLIQNQFRTYYARRKKRGDLGVVSRRDSERLKKGRNQSVIIQQRFRSHYQRRSFEGRSCFLSRSHYQRRSFEGKEGPGQTPGSAEGPDSSPHRAEGRSSPCRDETRPADVDRSAASCSGDFDVSEEVHCDAERNNRGGDGVVKAGSGAGSGQASGTRGVDDGKRIRTDRSRGVSVTSSNTDCSYDGGSSGVSKLVSSTGNSSQASSSSSYHHHYRHLQRLSLVQELRACRDLVTLISGNRPRQDSLARTAKVEM
ncbi:hypothetical protein EGW08_012178 [Elysia chlorotica]|uniref:CG-1 domain-containing protein n=1 Tax=Elysia chlorotica TaxID=188477 RepID=A0A3S0ZKS7_ELYCH|nr:hypothetical protein EGW08_012178 [Elysia chlorotica]